MASTTFPEASTSSISSLYSTGVSEDHFSGAVTRAAIRRVRELPLPRVKEALSIRATPLPSLETEARTL